MTLIAIYGAGVICQEFAKVQPELKPNTIIFFIMQLCSCCRMYLLEFAATSVKKKLILYCMPVGPQSHSSMASGYINSIK